MTSLTSGFATIPDGQKTGNGDGMPRSNHVRFQPENGTVFIGHAAIGRLQHFGFSQPRILRVALQDGVSAARSSMTPVHPATYPGSRMWAETTASLSFLGQSDLWQHEPFLGVDLITNHNRGKAIIVTAGDGATGSEQHIPQVRYERREVITRLVNGELDTLEDRLGAQVEWEVWFLLHNMSISNAVIPAELSRPSAIGIDGWVTAWDWRIIIPTFEPEEGLSMEAGLDVTPAAPVVRVQRRGG